LQAPLTLHVPTLLCARAGAQILRYRVAHNRTCCVSRAEAERREHDATFGRLLFGALTQSLSSALLGRDEDDLSMRHLATAVLARPHLPPAPTQEHLLGVEAVTASRQELVAQLKKACCPELRNATVHTGLNYRDGTIHARVPMGARLYCMTLGIDYTHSPPAVRHLASLEAILNTLGVKMVDVSTCDMYGTFRFLAPACEFTGNWEEEDDVSLHALKRQRLTMGEAVTSPRLGYVLRRGREYSTVLFQGSASFDMCIVRCANTDLKSIGCSEVRFAGTANKKLDVKISGLAVCSDEMFREVCAALR
jgi:hypothetical protein